MIESVRTLWEHIAWADAALLDALRAVDPGPRAVREYAHIIGAEEVWLARLEGRTPRLAVWPDVSIDDLGGIVRGTHSAWAAYLGRLDDADLRRTVDYTNSAGRAFTNSVADIALHVALHGQYHRGKVNLLLREAALVPASTDYIAFVRGAAAATEADHPRSGGGS